MAEQNAAGWSTPYKFTGKELDDITGLYYFGARYYDPRISLWMSVDPLAEKYPGWSAYNYVYNNPLKFVDPTGVEGESIHEDATGRIVAIFNDRDNNVYRHNEIVPNGQHIDGIRAYIEQKKELYGTTSGGGEKQIVKSIINYLYEFSKGNGFTTQIAGTVFTGENGGKMGLTFPKNTPHDMINIDDFLSLASLCGPGPVNSDAVYEKAIKGDFKLVEKIGKVTYYGDKAAGTVERIQATKKYIDPTKDKSLKLDSVTHQKYNNQTVEHYSSKNKK
jgi:RHS repeat-associated protein